MAVEASTFRRRMERAEAKLVRSHLFTLQCITIKLQSTLKTAKLFVTLENPRTYYTTQRIQIDSAVSL